MPKTQHPSDGRTELDQALRKQTDSDSRLDHEQAPGQPSDQADQEGEWSIL
jgi:hypothetical protein